MNLRIRIICLALSALMLVTALISCKNTGGADTGTPAPSVTDAPDNTENTEDTGSTNIPEIPDTPEIPLPEFEKYLLSKWDFEGDDALADKSEGGKTREAVSVFGTAEARGGILTVYGSDGSYASIDAPEGSDLYDLKNKTVVFKAKINNDFSGGYVNNIAGILSKESGYDVYFSNEENGRLSQFRYNKNGSRPYFISESKTPLDGWRVYAVTVKYTEDSRAAKLCFYKSKVEDPKSASDMELIYSNTVSDVDGSFLAGGDPIILGKRFDHTGAYRALKSDIAEFRVYGKAFTPDELAEIPFDSAADASRGELSALIEYAEGLTPVNRSESDVESFKNAINAAKSSVGSADAATIKSAVSKLTAAVSLMTVRRVADTVGSLTLIPYNDPSLDVPIATGLHAFPGFYDIDSDGDMDFVSSSQSISYGGYSGGVFMLYKNGSGNVGATHFDIGEVLQYAAKSPWFSYKTDGTPVFVSEGGYFYEKLTYRGLEDGEIISGLTRYYKLYDVDGDGLSDAVFPVNKSSTPAKDEPRYDENGKTLQSASSGLCWIKNTGTEDDPVFSTSRRNVLDTKGKEFKVSDEMQYTFFRSFSMFDWDGDGDLDLIAGGWQNEFYYYENKGNKTNPVFDPDGVRIETEAGVLKLDVCRYNIINYEWSGDGIDDLFIGTESGTTVYLVFKGFNSETGAPVFIDKGYMMTDAEHLWVNALSRPTACDFDGDGDTDFIVGDNCGLLWFYENLTGGASPSWAYPVKMRDENGEILVIKAGYNGSFQGTAEAEWGYTVPSACDWDGDGDIDIVANSVTGHIVWFENIGTKTNGQLTRPRAVEVEWTNGNKYPEWLVWVKPLGNELITQHRTTPYAMDFNGDGLCDLIMLDHEGYLAYFERYEENGALKLKEGERIFCVDGKPLRLNDGIIGNSGRIKFVVVDWDGDGLRDVLVGKKTMVFYKNIGVAGKVHFLEDRGELSEKNISGHNHGFTVVDFNGDGKPDLVSGSESGYFYCLINES